MRRLREFSPWIAFGGYPVALLGLITLVPFFWGLWLQGRFRIKGYWRFMRCVTKGRLLIVANHPSIISETFFLGAIPGPLILLPWGVIWTMPDVRLLKGWWKTPRWWPTSWREPYQLIASFVRSITVDRRSSVQSGRGGIKVRDILDHRGIVVVNPEMGRTFGEANRGKVPIRMNGRLMQRIDRSTILAIAHETKATILPLWLDVPFHRDALKQSEEFLRIVRGDDGPITYYFGEPYRIEGEFDLARENERAQRAIMSA